MKRLLILILSVFLILTFSCKKETTNKDIIGISKIVSHPALDAVENGIKDELFELGYISLVYDLQNANGEPAIAKQIANKFKAENVKVAVGIATPAAQALVSILTETPIVFSAVTDPVIAGLVTSASEGEENVTGVSDLTPVEQQIKLLTKIVNVNKIGFIYSSNEANSVTIANLAKETCNALGIEFLESTITNSAEVKQAAESIINKVDAIYIGTDNTVISALSSIIDIANNNNVPIISADPSSAEELGVLVAYGFNYYKMGRITGKIIADILNGKKTIDMPTKYMNDSESLDLIINLDIAKQLNIKVPENILEQANKIIENDNILLSN